MKSTETTTPEQDPKHHPIFARRYNPAAWKDCAIPPFPGVREGPKREAFYSWPISSDHPEDAMTWNFERAWRGLSFLHWTFRTISNTTGQLSKDGSFENIDLPHEAVEGLATVLGFIGESLDLAEQAAGAALEEAKKQTA